MARGDRELGWWEAPAAPLWVCPECNQVSDPDEWPEQEMYCEDCGSHDGRACPRCGEVFDHVWGAARILAPEEGT